MMYERRGIQFVNGLVLRIIGTITMTLDHIGLFLLMYQYNLPDSTLAYNVGSAFRVVGRIAFPIFIFLLAEGMRHTRHKEKYLIRLFSLFAVINIALAILIYGRGESSLAYVASSPFNDLFFAALTLYFLSKKGWWKLLSILPAGVIIGSFILCCGEAGYQFTAHWWPFAFRPSYSIIGLGAAIGFYYAPIITVKAFHGMNQDQGISDEMFLETNMGRRGANMLGCLFLFAVVIGLWGLSHIDGGAFDYFPMSLQSWCMLAIVPLLFYNGRRGPDSVPLRIFNYAYFPLHIVVLYFIFQAIIS